MKRIIAFLIITISIFLIACDTVAPIDNSSDESTVSDATSDDATCTGASSEFSDSSSKDNSGDISSESEPTIEEKYPFLISPYSVSTKTRVHEVTYLYTYYFIKGRVIGAVQKIALENEEDAKEYFDILKNDYPDVQRQGTFVTVYLKNDEINYSGYSLKKLKFVLEKAGYEYRLNFDEEEFNEQYSSIDD